MKGNIGLQHESSFWGHDSISSKGKSHQQVNTKGKWTKSKGNDVITLGLKQLPIHKRIIGRNSIEPFRKLGPEKEMGRGEKGPVSCRLSSSSSFLKFLLIMIQLTVVYQFASTWGFTSHHPWLWNLATTATITTVKIPEISFDFVLNHSSRHLIWSLHKVNSHQLLR
ncbi:hypothetical protein CK203_063998 [Vitis vinifera]|uniref:Uncharacterized protein n=1 Tax=Vitis vinifera TaxID=29760 RepID=A0A438G526_VITVI|nr:hypothetical protein CK203_063998 [Vitis vinifera]